MVIPEPREHLRQMIAENEGKRRNGSASDGRGWYRTAADRMECFAIADAVMELFPQVSSEVEAGWWLSPEKVERRMIIACTEPVPVEEN